MRTDEGPSPFLKPMLSHIPLLSPATASFLPVDNRVAPRWIRRCFEHLRVKDACGQIQNTRNNSKSKKRVRQASFLIQRLPGHRLGVPFSVRIPEKSNRAPVHCTGCCALYVSSTLHLCTPQSPISHRLLPAVAEALGLGCCVEANAALSFSDGRSQETQRSSTCASLFVGTTHQKSCGNFRLHRLLMGILTVLGRPRSLTERKVGPQVSRSRKHVRADVGGEDQGCWRDPGSTGRGSAKCMLSHESLT